MPQPSNAEEELAAGLRSLELRPERVDHQSSADEADELPSSTWQPWLNSFVRVRDPPGAWVKLFVSNAAAGSIIGKAGATIGAFQRDTTARIQLSRNGDYFPGTTDRILLVSGRLKNVLAALDAILQKLIREKVAPVGFDPRVSPAPTGTDVVLQLRLLVPGVLCGIVIGKEGQTIRQFVQETTASIRVATDELYCASVLYRVVFIIGKVDAALKAVALVVNKLAEDPKYALFCNVPPPLQVSGSTAAHISGSDVNSTGALARYSIAPPAAAAGGMYLLPPAIATGGAMSVGALNGVGMAPAGMVAGVGMPNYYSYGGLMQRIPFSEAPRLGIAVEILPSQADALLAKNRRLLSEIQKASGAFIEVDNATSASHSRQVMITGTPEAVHHAHWLMLQRLLPVHAGAYVAAPLRHATFQAGPEGHDLTWLG